MRGSPGLLCVVDVGTHKGGGSIPHVSITPEVCRHQWREPVWGEESGLQATNRGSRPTSRTKEQLEPGLKHPLLDPLALPRVVTPLGATCLGVETEVQTPWGGRACDLTPVTQ